MVGKKGGLDKCILHGAGNQLVGYNILWPLARSQLKATRIIVCLYLSASWKVEYVFKAISSAQK